MCGLVGRKSKVVKGTLDFYGRCKEVGNKFVMEADQEVLWCFHSKIQILK